jgi:cyclophilin family peptidyl-prolyl cis-trans isomerase
MPRVRASPVLFAALAALSCAPAPWSPAPAVADAVVVVETSLGTFQLTLDGAKAPRSTANFLAYVDAAAYDGTVFHRVISDFMIQGGGFDGTLSERPSRDAIVNEARNGLRNVRGTIAMARTSDPDSATDQFFINVVDNPGLDYPNPDGAGYAVFGHVSAGLDVVDRIRVVPTGDRSGMSDVPVTNVVIEHVRRAP